MTTTKDKIDALIAAIPELQERELVDLVNICSTVHGVAIAEYNRRKQPVPQPKHDWRQRTRESFGF